MPASTGEAPLLATKLFVPRPRDNRVERPRLRERLSRVRGGSVSLIAAAAGWGKSTLLADWALESTTRVAWLSLDESDDDPRRFVQYVVAALKEADAFGGDDIIEGPRASSKDAIETSLTEVLNAVALRGAPVTMVFDDYHAIQSRAVHDAVQFLIDHLPPNLHIVIATRVDPPLALSRLRARGVLHELRGDDLRFTAAESLSFLNGTMGLALTGDEVGELERRTEGWVVGLQMAAISLRGREASREFISAFGGSNRHVLDYLTEEVLARQPDDVRDFLLETSILTRLSAPLCDAVCARNDSERILRQLDAASLFLIPLDDVRYWFRYHHLFGTLLQHHLTRSRNPQQIAELHARASKWYFANAMPEPALDHALTAQDVDGAVKIVAASSMPRVLTGDTASVVRWIDRIPRERIENDLDLTLTLALALIADYQINRALATVQRAESLLPPDASDEKRAAILGLRGTVMRMYGHIDEGTRMLEEALELAPKNNFWYSLASYGLGLSQLMRADMPAVIAGLAPVRARHQQPGQLMAALLGQTYTAWCEWQRGRPEEAMRLGQELFAWIDTPEHAAAGHPLYCFPNAILADVHATWNELETARAFAERAVDYGRRGFAVGLFESLRCLGRVAESQGDWDAALRATNEATRTLTHFSDYMLWAHAVDAMKHRIVLRRWQREGNRADFDTVKQWVITNDAIAKLRTWETRRVGSFYCDIGLLVAVRVLLEEETFGEAIELLDEMLPYAIDTERLLGRIEILILKALALARNGRVEEGVATMTHALDLAAPPRCLRIFLDEGPALFPLIERASSRFAPRVLSAFEVSTPPASVELLSDREIEVLRLVASGVTNQEAGRKLFIAPGTVKKHLENIYAKLDARGRTEAIARARELKLL